MRKTVFSFVAVVLLITVTGPARAALMTDSFSWPGLDGLDIQITYPDKVTYNTPFSVSLYVDSVGLTGALTTTAFWADVQISDTVNMSGAAWSYELNSTSSVISGGTFTDSGSVTPVSAHSPGSGFVTSVYTGSGYDVLLEDPLNPSLTGGRPYTWLYKADSENVTWTLSNIVILDHTNIQFTLDDNDVLGSSNFPVTAYVLDPPPPSVPLPASLFLLMTALLGLPVMAKRGKSLPA